MSTAGILRANLLTGYVVMTIRSLCNRACFACNLERALYYPLLPVICRYWLALEERQYTCPLCDRSLPDPGRQTRSGRKVDTS